MSSLNLTQSKSPMVRRASGLLLSQRPVELPRLGSSTKMDKVEAPPMMTTKSLSMELEELIAERKTTSKYNYSSTLIPDFEDIDTFFSYRTFYNYAFFFRNFLLQNAVVRRPRKEEITEEYNICITGASCGKSCLTIRFCYGRFDETNDPTLGKMQFCKKNDLLFKNVTTKK